MKSYTIYKTGLSSIASVLKSSNIYKTGLTSILAAAPFILSYLVAEAKAFNELSQCVNCYSYQPYTDSWGEKLSPIIESERLMSINDNAERFWLIGLSWSITIIGLSIYKGTHSLGIIFSILVVILFAVSSCSLNAANSNWF
ncbi:hypothetical protein OAJ44_04540 [Chloroflexi bacterium]|nr:hypothetical protein [Chloroflexota bacterium]